MQTRLFILFSLARTASSMAQMQLVNGASYFNTSFAPQSIAVAYGSKLATSS